MSDKKKFLLRMEEEMYSALEKWAADDLRSVNAQIEFLLSKALREAGRTDHKKKSSGRKE
jgi:hypothetical protein